MPRKTLPPNTRSQIDNILWKATDLTSLGILLALYTGIRIGELCGLKWGDIDFENSSINIHRTVERIVNPTPEISGTKTVVVIDTPKTSSAKRIIPLPSLLLDHIIAFRESDNRFLLTGSEKS